MLDDNESTPTSEETGTDGAVNDPGADQAAAPARKAAAKKAAKAPAKRAARKTPAKKAAAATEDTPLEASAETPGQAPAEAPAEAPSATPADGAEPVPAKKAAKRAPAKRTAKKAAAEPPAVPPAVPPALPGAEPDGTDETAADAPDAPGAPAAPMVLFQAPPPAKKTAKKAAKKTAKKVAAGETGETLDAAAEAPAEAGGELSAEGAEAGPDARPAKKTAKKAAKKTAKKAAPADETTGDATASASGAADGEARATPDGSADDGTEAASEDRSEAGSEDRESGEDGEEGGARRRPRRRGGRRRRKPADSSGESADTDEDSQDGDDQPSGGRQGQQQGRQQGRQQDGRQDGRQDGQDDEGDSESAGSRRRRRRRRSGDDGDGSDDPENTVVRVRKPRNSEDEITSISGSTRLEAKKQRRREGREAGRRRAPIVSEAEFLARREAVDRTMVIRQRDDLTQIAVLEDKVLVEHYVARESQTSLIGNVYLGRVQNVLPSMEAAFVDIGMGRNAVIYAGEVNWAALGHKDGQPRKIESVLKSGQTILVQVTKDPIGHKGARLTGQVSLPGRFLVYVPDGTTSGISRKLPDTERNRLKTLLKEIVPDTAGVIVRTAAEGASEDELTHDVERLTARWSDIEAKVKDGRAPQLLYGEPDLTLKVVRDLFTEDFARLVVQGDDAWDLVDGYVSHVAPDLRERLERFSPGEDGKDLFEVHRITEQIAKGLDRKVWLPSGGSLVIDRTEAMTVVDVNTGKFTGSGGNLEETVTKNNLEAAEEIVRQLRLRDIGGIIVVDFIDMVLESNRDLVLRRLVECLGRDRTRHQVAEVTSLGLVQMTRKRIGTGLLEAFGEDCAHCKGRGVVVHDHPIEDTASRAADDEGRGRRSRGGRARRGGESNGNGSDGSGSNGNGSNGSNGSSSGSSNGGRGAAPEPAKPSPKDLAGTRPHPEPEDHAEDHASAGHDDGSRADDQRDDRGAASGEDLAPVVAEAETPTTHDAPVAEATVVAAVEEQPAIEPVAEPAEPAAPRVVTTRRRTARRPAGPPVAAPEATTPDTAPAAASADQAGDHATDHAADQAGEPDGTDESGAGSFHVPVKRKGGSRKR